MTGATVATSPVFASLAPGDAAPWFKQRSSTNPNFSFDVVAGRYIVMCFFGTSAHAGSQAALNNVYANRPLFDDDRITFFGISFDPRDEANPVFAKSETGFRYFWDHDGAVSRLYGAIPTDGDPARGTPQRQFWLILDPTLRVMFAMPFKKAGSEWQEVTAFLEALPPPAAFAGFEVPAPILVIPNTFEAGFCQRLIADYDANGGAPSGFMREVDGKTVAINDVNHKRRDDHFLKTPELMTACLARIRRRVVPEIQKVYAFEVTRMERYLVGCYPAEEGGHFRAHRDNTTKGTAHRRFAVSINLNSDFEGGELGFPEYGPRRYKAAAGCAIVFPCALLHAVAKVTSGRRYAFLPFLYDEAAAAIREENNKFLDAGVGQYSR